MGPRRQTDKLGAIRLTLVVVELRSEEQPRSRPMSPRFTAIRSNPCDRVQAATQVSALPIPLDWPKFAMTLIATCGLLMVLALIQIR